MPAWWCSPGRRRCCRCRPRRRAAPAWRSDGAKPGARRGSALVTGHTVHTGGGALDDLETLGHGDLVKISTSNGWITYAVRTTKVYAKGSLARHATSLFSQTV